MKPRRQPLTRQQQAMITPEMVDLVLSVAGKRGRRFPYLADQFESDALLALTQAARGYEADRGTTFKTYLISRLRAAMQDTLRDSAPCGYRRKPDAPEVCSLPNYDTGRHLLSEPDPPVGWEMEARENFEQRINRLRSDVDRQILRMVFIDNLPMNVISAAFGNSVSWASSRHLRAIEQLRHANEVDPNGPEDDRDDGETEAPTSLERQRRPRTVARADRHVAGRPIQHQHASR